MNLYFSQSYSEEDGTVEKANSGMIYASKDELFKICEFFEKVKKHIESNNNCHMHLRDNYEDWEKNINFDLEVTLKENE